MGNCFAMNQSVHPSDLDGPSHGAKGPNQLPGTLQVKVRMTRREFKELMAQADLSKGHAEIARLIVQECFEGKCDARLVSLEDGRLDSGTGRNLETITEEET